jgi:hypothetical protein
MIFFLIQNILSKIFQEYSKNIVEIFPPKNHKIVKNQAGVVCVISFAPK